MSMYFCPECSERLSSSATVCPHCGFPIVEELARDPATARSVLDLLVAKGTDHSLRDLASDESASPGLLEALARVSDVELARLVAQNPNTPSATLHRLAFVEDEELRFSIARNARTSTETLTMLYEQVRRKEPGSEFGFPDAAPWEGVSGDGGGHRAIKVALALNRNTAVDVLNGLYDDSDYVVSAAALGNDRLPEQLCFGIDGVVVYGMEKAGPCGMLNPLIPYKDLLVALRYEDKPSAAKNARLYGCAEIIDRLRDGRLPQDIHIEAAIGAGSPTLPAESLRAIESAGRGYPEEIVLNPAVTPDVLERAFGEPLAGTVWVAKDPRTPGIVVESLYRRSPDAVVRVAAATNPGIPVAVFVDRFGKASGAADGDTDDGGHRGGFEDTWDDVGPAPEELDYSGWEYEDVWREYGMGADVAYWDDAAMEALMPEIEAERAERAAMEEAAEISKYEQEAADYEEQCKRDYWEFLIDYAFAANPSTPGDALRILARRGGDIAMAVACNPGAPQDLLERLFEDDDCWDAVIMNPAASFDLLEGLGKVDEGQASAKADERDEDGREQERDVIDWDVIPF